MGVFRPWRARGFGRRLLAALILVAHEAGIPALSLSVESDNNAYRLYEDFGFNPVTRASGSITMKLHL